MPAPAEEEYEQDAHDVEEQELDAEIVPNSVPPEVPQDGTYIDALNEAGVDPKRIEQLQQSKLPFTHLVDVDAENANAEADEFNIWREYSQEEIENYRCIFDMFDKEQTGFVNVGDL